MEIKAELLYPYEQEDKERFIVEQNHNNGYEIREVRREKNIEITVPDYEDITETIQIEVPYTEIEEKEIEVEKPVYELDEETGEQVQIDTEIVKETIEVPVEKVRLEETEITTNKQVGSHIEVITEVVIDIQAWGYTEEEIEQQKREQIGNLELTGADVERAIYEAKGMDFEDLVQFVIDSELVGFDVKRLKIELKANHFVRKHPYINIIGSMLGYSPDDMDYLFLNKTFPVKEDIEDEQNVVD